MKYVKEYINEKFTSESDPIKDLGIGIEFLFKRDREITGTMYDSQASMYYFSTEELGRESFIIYRTINRVVENGDYSTKNIQETYNTIVDEHYNHYNTIAINQNKIIEIFYKFYGIKLNKKNINKEIYEKFTDSSDPIKDLGIGMMHQIEKFLNEKEPALTRPEYVWACAKYNKIKYLKYLIEIGDNIHYEYEKPLKVACIKGNYKIVKILLEAGANPNINNNEPRKYARMYGFDKIVKLLEKYTKNPKNKIKKFVNEKFTDSSDPIHDMGIGLEHVFKHLKIGDILRFKEDLQIEGGGQFFPKNSYIKISQISYDEYERIIITYKYYSKKNHLKSNNPSDVNASTWRMSYEFFKDHFAIEKLLKESLNEKFTEESDPIKDMGIGLRVVRNFKSATTAVNFILKMLPAILKTDKIPDDIVFLPEKGAGAFKYKYYYIITDYLRKYIRINDAPINLESHNICYLLWKRLLKLGYPKVEQSHNPDNFDRHNKPVFEKFIADSDPIRDMGIGLYVHRNFKTINDAENWLLEHIPAILKLDKMPDDIICPPGGTNLFPWEYWTPLNKFIAMYITVNNVATNFTWFDGIIKTMLSNQGYPK